MYSPSPAEPLPSFVKMRSAYLAGERTPRDDM